MAQMQYEQGHLMRIHNSDMKVWVNLVTGLRLAPTPLDECVYDGLEVYCYFLDSGYRVKTLVGHIPNDNISDEAAHLLHSNKSCGKLQIIDSGVGHRVLASIMQ